MPRMRGSPRARSGGVPSQAIHRGLPRDVVSTRLCRSRRRCRLRGHPLATRRRQWHARLEKVLKAALKIADGVLQTDERQEAVEKEAEIYNGEHSMRGPRFQHVAESADEPLQANTEQRHEVNGGDRRPVADFWCATERGLGSEHRLV